MSFAFPAGRFVLIAGLVLFGLTACGRREALEAPPDPAAIAREQEKAAQRRAARASLTPSVTPSGQQITALEGQTNVPGQAQVTDGGDADSPDAEGPAASTPGILDPSRKRARRQPFVIPKEPFILDPLL